MEGGRRQGDTFHCESWVSQSYRLAKERKDLGSATTPEPGFGARVTCMLTSAAGGVTKAGEVARERKRRRVHTPHRPGISSIGRKPRLTSKPRLAGGTPTSPAGGTEREKEGCFTPCERGRAHAGVHGYANGVYGTHVRTLAPRPLTMVRTAVATR
jgi:hypothetical protein